MRSILKTNPSHGAGYGIIEIYDVGEIDEPVIIIKRISDGCTLTSGGWQKGDHPITPASFEIINNTFLIFIGPEIVNNLSPNDNYELSMAGIGISPLEKSDIFQSDTTNANRQEAYAAAQPYLSTENKNDEDIYEKLNKKQEISSHVMEEGNLNRAGSGIEARSVAGKRGKKGCLFTSLLLFFIWLAGAFLLYFATLNAPDSPKDEKSAPFSFIPNSD